MTFAFHEPPENMTRMKAVGDVLVDAGYRPLLMDTGPAAIFGAAQDLTDDRPTIIINFGNGHTVAAVLVQADAAGDHHGSAGRCRHCSLD